MTATKTNQPRPTQERMFYRAGEHLARATQAFLELCHPDRYGMPGADPMTLAEFNTNAARNPELWERYRPYAEKNLK